MSIIVEDGTGLENAESYVSVATANEYFTKRGKSKWPIIEIIEGENDDDPVLLVQEACLINATEYIDSHYVSSISSMGTKTNSLQSLLFPRIGFIPRYDTEPHPSNIIPVQIRNATCALAYLAYMGVDLYTTASQGALIKRKKIGQIETEWDTSTYSNKPVFDEINTMLAPLLPIQVDSSIITSGRIIRA